MGKGKRVTVRRSAEEWRAIMSRFERSGQTHGQFCAAEDLAPSTFSLWRRKLRQSAREANGASAFVELADSPAPSSAWDAELDLSGGVVLRLRRVSRC